MGAGCSSTAAATAAAPLPAAPPAPSVPPPAPSVPPPAAHAAKETACAGATAAARTVLMRNCFAAMDYDDSGSIDLAEWKKYLTGAGVAAGVVEEQAAMLMKRMDRDDDAKISVDEFTAALQQLTRGMSDGEFADLVAGIVNACRDAAVAAGVKGMRAGGGEKLSALLVKDRLAMEMRVAKLRLCFSALDADQSGFIEIEEFKQYLKRTGATDRSMLSEVEALITRMDKDGDRKVSLEEYMCSMADFKNTVSDAAFAKLVDGVFDACSGKVISSNVLSDALNARLK